MTQRLKRSAVVFNEAPHTYFLGEKELKGVTTILHSLPMFASMYETKTEKALKENKVWKESGYKTDELVTITKDCGTIQVEPVDFDNFLFVGTNEELAELQSLIEAFQRDKVRLEFNKFNAAIRGTAVHNACEAIDRGEETDNADAMEHARKYKELRESLMMEPFATEYLVSDEDFVASSIDLVWQDKFGKFVLADIKCVSSMDETYQLYLTWQLSVYKYLFELQNPSKKVSKIYGVWLPQKEQYGRARIFELMPIEKEEVIKMLECCKRGEVYGQEEIEQFTLPATIQDDLQKYLEAKKRIKDDTDFVKAFEASMLKTFEKNDVKKFDIEGVGSFTRTLPGITQKFDSTRFKEENPEIYEQYLKTTETKSSLRVTLK